MAASLSNVLVEPCTVTWGSLDLGYLDGDVEITTEEKVVEIMAHQMGTNVLDAIRTGKSVEVALTMKEAAVAKLVEIVKAGGAEAASAAQVATIETVADVGGSLNNLYFFINTAGDAAKYMVWLNVNSEGVAPTLPAGYTAAPVALATGATAAQVATAIAAVLDALAGFVSTATDDLITVTNAAEGVCSAPSAGNSGFTFAVTTAGANALPGWGTSKDFTGLLAGADKLVLHPVAAGASLARDVAFWKAYPMLDSIVFSGENPKTAAVTFKVFPDLTKAAESRWFVIGDHT